MAEKKNFAGGSVMTAPQATGRSDEPVKPVTAPLVSTSGKVNEKPDETKAQKFVRLANRRVNKLITVCNHVANLANKRQYARTADQTKRLLDRLEKAFAHISRAYSEDGTTKESEFSL